LFFTFKFSFVSAAHTTQCKLVANIKKRIDNNEYKYVCIKLVHTCWENWQYALTMQVWKEKQILARINLALINVTAALVRTLGVHFGGKAYLIN
jgi:hypothetical protein